MYQQVPSSRRNLVAGFCAILSLVVLLSTQTLALAQDGANYKAERERAMQLFNKSDFIGALPLLEKLSKENSSDSGVFEALGFSLYASTISMKDPNERAQVRAKARAALQRAQELGDNSNLLQITLENLSAGDVVGIPFSDLKEADKAIREGEESFARGDFDKALAAYQRALKLDPKLYYAALFAGDVQFKKGYNTSDTAKKNELLNSAGEWFARAIAINENIETAYRYWGDALALQGKQQEALLKFIDAIIAEPGNNRGYMGLSQWGQQNQIGMAHPKIEVPVKLSMTGDNKLNVSFDPALRDSADGSGAWEQYGVVRAKWVAEDFAKAYPNETAYRHTLREETEALRKVAETASELLKSGKVKSLSPSLAALVKLNEAGLLEPYIFFARADQGIARDYLTYRQANRDKLRLYWKEFVVQK